jgi:hypothetical protein
MNSVFFKRASLLLTLTTLSVFSGGLSAEAQTNNSNLERKDNKVLTSASVLKSETGTVVAQVEPTAPDNATPSTPGTDGITPTTPGTDGTYTPTTPGTDGTYTPTTPDPQSVPPTTTPDPQSVPPTTTPDPQSVPPTTTPETTPTQETTPNDSTFGDDVEPGRATRGGSSYIGVAGNIGLSGSDTGLGGTNFSVISKIGFTNAVSVRPSVVIGDNTTILIPVTYDFSVRPTGVEQEAISTFAPYIGAGIGIATGDSSDVGPMLTAGVDVPITPQFTATAGVNAGFFDDVSVGLAIGVGYNFGGF